MSVEKRMRVLPALCAKFGAIVLLALLAGACSSDKYERDRNAASDTLFQKGSEAISNRNYTAAIFYLEQLGARYPFSENAKQAQLNLLYVYYKNDEPESAIDAADNFIRENPTHPRVDYAYYIKGLVNFPKEKNSLERLFRVDRYARPPKGLDDSFSAFSTLIARFPGSLYAPDARERMIYLRNRLAQYQIYVAEWYVRRGSYVAASHRARSVLEEYAGSTSAYQAMELLAICYNKLGLKDLEADTRELLTLNQGLKNASKRLEQ
ncbi:MAG: outer membrane protein assembly factor BamD [Gammaproteobacteria bacterium]|nr:outer membrane protein assembly factor BamD [Gammaproteobacteria bacterium]